MSNTLQLQLDIAGYLGAHSSFQYVPIICEYRDEKPGDALFDDYVLKHLKGEIPKNGKFGLCVIIGTPKATVTAPNTPGPVEDFVVEIQVVEHKGNNMAPTIGTCVRADDMYELVKRMLHLHCHDGSHDLVVVNSEQDDALPSSLRGFVIELHSSAHALDTIQRTPLPRINLDADPSMSITCEDGDAAIYWTHDGSFPSPANATAALYVSAVDVGELPAGTVIRAVAYHEPLRGSDCVAEVI